LNNAQERAPFRSGFPLWFRSLRRRRTRIFLDSRGAWSQAEPMGTSPIVRKARPADAEAIARIYVASWRDTYPLVLPARALSAMTIEGQSARWRNAIALAVRESVLVAEDEKGRILGMSSMGRARDTGVGYDAEVYTLYVDPLMTGRGIGRLLLAGAFAVLTERGHTRCVIWAHAGNPARFFYEAMGGKAIAERTTSMMGVKVPEIAFGWPRLALAERTRKSEIGSQKP
jgi:GNAT superfamily N-acetyltransferase